MTKTAPALLFGLLIFALAACTRGAMPAPTPTASATPTLEPTATPTVTLEPTATPTEDLHTAVQDLFDRVAAAQRQRDGATFFRLLSTDVRSACTQEQIQATLDQAQEPVSPGLRVGRIFLDTEEGKNALVRLELQEMPEEGLEAFAALSVAALLTVFPWPIVQETGEWRLGSPLRGLFHSEGVKDQCPFAPSPDPVTDAATPTPSPASKTAEGPLAGLRNLPLPAGASSVGSGRGYSSTWFESSSELRTDMSVPVLFEYYRNEVLDPSWSTDEARVGEELAYVTWTIRDTPSGSPWLGTMVVAKAEHGLMARLSLIGSGVGAWAQEQQHSPGEGLPASASPREGQRVPDVQIHLYRGEDALGGQDVRLSTILALGKPVVLNIWGGLCPPCREEMPALQDAYEDYQDRIFVIGLDAGPFVGFGSNEDGRALLVELGIRYPAGSTLDSEALQAFRITGMPTTYFLRPTGVIHRIWAGNISREKIVEFVEELLAEKLPPPPLPTPSLPPERPIAPAPPPPPPPPPPLPPPPLPTPEGAGAG